MRFTMPCWSPPDNLNEIHDVDQYPHYYDSDPVYFPSYYPSLFDTEESVCEWLWKNLRHHFLNCTSCDIRPHFLEMFDDSVHYRSFRFEVSFGGVFLQVPISYIECQSFSFCNLHRRLLLLKRKLHLASLNTEESSKDLVYVLSQLPVWLLRDLESCSLSLSALSVTELRSRCSLNTFPFRRKAELIEGILEDFNCERVQFWNIITMTTEPCALLVSRYFHDRYGNAIAFALRDFRSPEMFKDSSSHITCTNRENESWLDQSFEDMFIKLRSVSKDDLLQSLQKIPSHLRPVYSSRSIQGS